MKFVNSSVPESGFSKLKPMGENDIQFVPIASIKRQTEDEYMLRFDVSIDHAPGQFMQVSLLGVGEAPMSICSSSKDYFEISVRSVGAVSSKLCSLKKGDVVGMRGPYGRGYPMNTLEGNNVIVIGGGSGVAPVRGVVEHICQNRKSFGSVDLFFGFRTHMDMLFFNDFEKWTDNKMNIDVIFSEKSNHIKYKKEGMITDLLDGSAFDSNDKKIVFICGPPIMIKFVCQKLISKGFNSDQIFLSEEKHMKCGVGRCGHCMIGDKYCCTDGPVFRYDELLGANEGYKRE